MSSWRERLQRGLKWLYPGLGVKRYLLLTLVGLFAFMSGFLFFWRRGVFLKERTDLLLNFLDGFFQHPLWGFLLLFSGLILLFWGLQLTGSAIAGVLLPGRSRNLVEKLFKRRYLERGPKIVALGGGTGLSVLLRGLKEYTSNITAIVTVTDDGGSSGRLRGEMGVLPPGDLRACLLALADRESLLEQLFQYRFEKSEDLGGHSFGNLFIVAMVEMLGLSRALQEFNNVLAIRGTVLPVTLEQVTLCAVFADGTKAAGETRIVAEKKRIKHISLCPPDCPPLPRVLAALAEADIILLGPGSLYTSVLPNLLFPGIREALRAAPAPCYYICNVMTQPGETEGFSAAEHLEVLFQHGCAGLIDGIVVNNSTDLPPALLEKYQREGARLVEVDPESFAQWPVRVLAAPLLDHNEVVRHDSKKLAALLLKQLAEWETGLDRLWSYTLANLNGDLRRARRKKSGRGTADRDSSVLQRACREKGASAGRPLAATQKKLKHFFKQAFRKV